MSPNKRRKVEDNGDTNGDASAKRETSVSQESVTEEKPVTHMDWAESPFTIRYCHPGELKKSSLKRKDPDESVPNQDDDPTIPRSLDVGYVVKPGSIWDSMKRYGNFIGKRPFVPFLLNGMFTLRPPSS